MRSRLALLLGVLVLPVLPLAVPTPAHALTVAFCVNLPPDPSCTSYGTLHEAIDAANAANTDVIVKVGPGTYSDGPYVLHGQLAGGTRAFTLVGSGAGTGPSATVLTLPPSLDPQTYLTGDAASVQDLRISMAGTEADGDIGLSVANGSHVDNVVVIGTAGITGAVGLRAGGSSVHDATVNLTQGGGNTGVVSTGGNHGLTDSTWIAPLGYSLSGAATDIVQRVTINASQTGVWVRSGTLSIDDSVLDLSAGSVAGLRAGAADTTAKTVDADYLTIVGPATRGVWADASASGVAQTVTIDVNSSIVRGAATSLVAEAAPGSTANLAVGHSDFESTSGAGVSEGAPNLDVDPAFIDPAGHDYALRATSPVLDKGAAAVAGLDRDGKPRSEDGDRDGIPVPDMGAYELHDVTPPTTVITAGPSGPTNDNTPVFTFRSGPDATFECRLDGSVFPSCKSPVTTTPLPDGPHTFTVQARDAVFNVEPNPPRRTFTVDTKAPSTSFVKRPPKRFFKPKVKFKFVATEPGARFRCKLDGLPWRSCRSPFRYSVKLGKHRLLVRAADAAGNVDPTPVRYTFKRIPRPKAHHHHHHHR